MSNKYQNAKIYCIASPNTHLLYVGSTCESLEHCLKGHEYDLKRWWNNNYCYISSFHILLCDECQISLLENYPCSNKYELHAREGYWIDHLGDSTVNLRREKGGQSKGREKEYHKSYDKQRVICPICNRELGRQSLWRHNERFHPVK